MAKCNSNRHILNKCQLNSLRKRCVFDNMDIYDEDDENDDFLEKTTY